MNRVVGGDLPAQIWHDFLSRAAPLLAKDKRQAPAAQVARADPEGAAADLSQQFVSEFQLMLPGFRDGGQHVQGQAF